MIVWENKLPFNFVDKLLEVTEIVESPTSFLRWSAYMALSAVMRHNIYYSFPARRSKIMPNLYVLLVGDSGATRKSTPLKICNYLLKAVNNTKIIEGRASIQGILKELAAIKTVQKPVHRQLRFASGIIYSEEFAASIVKDPAVTGILTDLYDWHEEHDIILRSEETMHLEKVCINLMSATNAAFIQDMFTKTDIYGGLVGRTFFIIEEKARHKNLGLRDETNENEWQVLVNHLAALSRVEGPAHPTTEALDFFEDWYNSTDFTLHESKTGYESRAHTHVQKLALVLAAAEEGFNLVIEKRHFEEAVDIVTELRKNYHKLIATAGYSTNTVVQAAKDIATILFQNPDRKLTRPEMMRMLFGRIDAENFDKAITTLDQTGYIDCGGTNVPLYSLSKKGRETILGEINVKGKVN